MKKNNLILSLSSSLSTSPGLPDLLQQILGQRIKFNLFYCQMCQNMRLVSPYWKGMETMLQRSSTSAIGLADMQTILPHQWLRPLRLRIWFVKMSIRWLILTVQLQHQIGCFLALIPTVIVIWYLNRIHASNPFKMGVNKMIFIY